MNLNTYRQAPANRYSLSKLEQISKERIELYKIFEEAKLWKFEEGTQQWSAFIISEIRKLKLYTYCTLLGYELRHGVLKSRREDNIAHWLVGLCYCGTTELQSLFINWELQWFRLLFINSKKSEIETFLTRNNLLCDTIDIEKYVYYDDLKICTNVNDKDYGDTQFYKANFYEIPEVVARREAFLLKGIAFFPQKDYIYYIKNKLQKEFLSRLEFQNKGLRGIDDRLEFLIDTIPKFIPQLYLGIEITDVNLETIDQIAKNHFPLCMRYLHNTLRTYHHLKYDCKMQYGIFLYWLGLSYEDAMTFWKNEFVQKMTVDTFNKKYSYLFKHQYGMVGRKRPYEQSTCSNILKYTPLPLQHHGCPFKHWSKSTLLETIEQDVFCLKDIEDLVDQNQYQKACTKYLCNSRNIGKDVLDSQTDVIESPIQYVIESFNIGCDVLDSAFTDNGAEDCDNLDLAVDFNRLNIK